MHYLLENNVFMKRTINESQLKAIVAESIKRVLGEMDWKTYQWAADERKRRNDDVLANGENSPYYEKYQKQGRKYYSQPEGRSFDSQRAAAEEFNRRYGMDTEEHPNGYTGERVLRNVYMDNYGDTNANYSKMGRYGTECAHSNTRRNLGKNFKGTNLSDPYRDAQLRDEFKNDTKIQDAYKKANDEVNNYRNGNYTYVKGKGWELKK